MLWNAFDDRYRPEMRGMERSLLLNQLDTSWKNHLYTMDHLRSGHRPASATPRIDPKTEYKREGMKEFDAMWEGVQDKVTDTVFRMEDDEELPGIALGDRPPCTKRRRGHAGAEHARPAASAIADSQQADKKPEPIRNRGDTVGRNDPCPCGSGKKYKNCCMRGTMVG